jgi:mono/diheme cytochrome c family protein
MMWTVRRKEKSGVVAATVLLLVPALGIAGHELDGRDIAEGYILYQENCASCHGVDLEGQPDWRTANVDGVLPAPPHNDTGHTWHHDNKLLFDYTKLGGEVALTERGITNFKSGMPGFGEVISEDEIWSILAYIRSTWPERIQETQALRNPPHD